MTKAVLVMDMPECCVDCCCGYFERYTKELNLVCGATGENSNNVVKPDWCPLRELPEHKRTIGTECESNRMLMNVGYNAGLDEILKERKE